MKWLFIDGDPRGLRGILLYSLLCSVLLRAWNSATTLFINMPLLRNVSFDYVEVVCSLFVIVSVVVSTLGSIALVFGSIYTLGSDALSFRLTLLFVGDDGL